MLLYVTVVFCSLAVSLVLLQLAVVTISSAISLLRNRRHAKTADLPYVLVPFFEINVAYGILARTPLFPLIVDHLLPAAFSQWARYCRPDWRFKYKYAIHNEHGDIVQVVAPGAITVVVADAAAAHEILQRRSDFVKMQRVLIQSALYGENVLTAEGESWRQHRKITGPPFSEECNEIVWSDTIRQATCLIDQWSAQNGSKELFTVNTLNKDMRRVALSVFSRAGFGIPQVLGHVENEEQSPEDGKQSFSDALEALTRNIRTTILVKLLSNKYKKYRKWWPASFEHVYQAYLDFNAHMDLLIDKEHNRSGNDKEAKANLLSALVQSQKEGDKNGASDPTLVKGNLWIFGIAGHETTANTLEYLIVALALHPECQQWFCETLDDELQGQQEDPAEWSYDLMASLTAPLCVIYETMRLYPVQPVVLRWTDDKTQQLNYDGTAHTIPPGSVVSINCIALHRNPSYWGKDADAFWPQRWDGRHPPEDPPAAPKRRYATIRPPPTKGAFLPFSEGFRGCLGRKFAEVEMVAAVVTLFKDHTVEIQRLPGESADAARARAHSIVELSSNQMAMAIRRDIGLVWRRRRYREEKVG